MTNYKDLSAAKRQDLRLRIKCAAIAYANDYGPLSAANAGEDAAQERLADNLISKLHEVGLTIVRSESN